MRPLGQHFLRNKNVIAKIIDSLELVKGDAVVEIGPGHGELTVPLAEACALVDASLITIEKDERLIRGLQEVLADKKVAIRHADIVKLLKTGSLDLGGSKFIGNVPYYITGALLRQVSILGKKPERCIFMLQEEVADRILAKPPKMNRLAASVQFWAEPNIIARVPKGDFSPPPRVDSAIVLLKVKKSLATEPDRYYEAVRTLFAQPRKTIANNILGAKRPAMTREAVGDALARINLYPEARPQDLTIASIAAVADLLFSREGN